MTRKSPAGNFAGYRNRPGAGAIRKDDWFSRVHPDRDVCMIVLKKFLLVLLVPLGLTAVAAADEKKPSLTYYYFDG